MFINQKDVLWGLDRDFVRQMMVHGAKEKCGKDHVIFREDDPADHLYILIKGHVRLSLGDFGHSIYIINHSGEIFGWSSIIGREKYTATAQCVQETLVYRIDRDPLRELLEKNPENGMRFYWKVAAALGDRLLHIYGLATPAAMVTTFGTRQVQDFPEAL